MALTKDFGLKAMNTMEEGYTASARALDASDIMDVSFERGLPDAISTVSQGNVNDTGVFASVSENKQNLVQSLLDGNTRTQTLLSKLYPSTSFAVSGAKTSALKVDPTKTVSAGASQAQATAGLKGDVKKQVGACQASWTQARRQACAALAESSKDAGVSPRVASDTLVNEGSATMVTAGAYIGAEAASAGMGSFATFASKSAFVGSELSKADRQLSPKQQEDLCHDALMRAQSCSVPNDSRLSAAGAVTSLTESQSVQPAWDNFTVQDFKDLLAADPNGMDQPEMQALVNLEKDLDKVGNNHGYVVDNYRGPDAVDAGLAGQSISEIALRGVSKEAVAMFTVGELFDVTKDAVNTPVLAPQSAASLRMG